MSLKRTIDSVQKLVGMIQKPHPVLGSGVSRVPFRWPDVVQILHFREADNTVVGVFKLSDGRFASIVHEDESSFCIGDLFLNEDTTHVANSYASIISLGLTDELRETLDLQ